MTMTLTTNGRSTIAGFNANGQRFAAVYNGGARYFVGRGGPNEISHATAEGEVSTFEEALAWVVEELRH